MLKLACRLAKEGSWYVDTTLKENIEVIRVSCNIEKGKRWNMKLII